MTAVQIPSTAPTTRRGRGWIIAGSLLMALSVLVGVVGTALTIGRVDFSEFDREIVFTGAAEAEVPGEVSFSVDEPLPGTADSAMTVGVAVRSSVPTAPTPKCSMATAAGETVQLSSNLFDTELYRDDAGTYTVVGSARLSPGDYVASCNFPGEPSQSPDSTTFTAGRTFGSEEFGDTFGPILGFFGVLAVGGFLFVLGVVLLIVGLVMRSRSNRPPTVPFGGQPYGAQPYGTQPYGAPPSTGYPAPPSGWQPPAPTSPPVGPPPAPPSTQWPTPPGRG